MILSLAPFRASCSTCFSTTYVRNNQHYLVVPSARISLTLSCHPPNRSSLLAGLQGYTSHLHRAAVCRFGLVALLLLGHVKGSTRVYSLWARPFFSFNFDSFRDGGEVAVELLLCEVLPPGLDQYCLQHSCVVAEKLFLYPFS